MRQKKRKTVTFTQMGGFSLKTKSMNAKSLLGSLLFRVFRARSSRTKCIFVFCVIEDDRSNISETAKLRKDCIAFIIVTFVN